MAASTAGSAGVQAKKMFNLVNDRLAAGAARLNGGEYQDVEIAIVKATNHDEVPPKEKHVRTLKEAVASAPNRRKVIFIVHDMYERIKNSGQDWLVVLKTLMVYHRLMKADSQCNFKMEMGKYKDKRKLSSLLRLDNFTDNSGKDTWDYSAWVRAYSIYLDTRLEIYKSVSFDLERDIGGGETKLKTSAARELLDLLPRLQKLMQRVLGCLPEGAAVKNPVVMESLKWVLSECFRLYRATSEGVINLADRFFEMDRIDARKALDIYREAINSTERLQEFFAKIQNMSAGKTLQFPQLKPPPEDFLEQMEAYVKGSQGLGSEEPGRKATVVTRIGTLISRRPGPGEVSAGGPVSTAGISDNGNKNEASVEEGPNLLDLNDLSLDDKPAGNGVDPTPQADPFGGSAFGDAAFGDSAFGDPPSLFGGPPEKIMPRGISPLPGASPTPPLEPPTGANPLSLLDDWSGPSAASPAVPNPGVFQNDPFAELASPAQPPVQSFPTHQMFGLGAPAPPIRQPSPVPLPSPMQVTSNVGNPFAAGGMPHTTPMQGLSVSPVPGARPPQQRAAPQPYNIGNDPFLDMMSEIIPAKPASPSPGIPMRSDASPSPVPGTGAGVGWMAPSPTPQPNPPPVVGNPFGAPVAGENAGSLEGNPFGENAFPSAGTWG